MDESSTVPSQGIRCEFKYANFVKEFLLNNNLLNKNLQINKEEKKIVFPTKNLSKVEKETISHFITKSDIRCEIITTSFHSYSNQQKPINELLKQLIPLEFHELLPKSFDRVGNIILLKLEDNLIPYKDVIGDSFLKYFKVRGIFTKIDNVETTFRLAKWECIAGEKISHTIHNMNGLRFHVDIEKAYFNPRLNTEYLRIAEEIEEGEIVWDLFCGVGPFILTAGSKKHAEYHGNDLNPEAIELLKKNIELNKKRLMGSIYFYNEDALEIIKRLPYPTRIFMNLPEHSLQIFPQVIHELKVKRNKEKNKSIHIHLYHFGHKKVSDKADLTLNEELQVVITKLKENITKENYQLEEITTRILRVVSPNKTQYVTKIKIIIIN